MMPTKWYYEKESIVILVVHLMFLYLMIQYGKKNKNKSHSLYLPILSRCS